MENQITTTEAKELTVYESGRVITPDIWQLVNEMAPVMHRCRLFGVSSVEQAAAIMLKGYELGIPFTASFEFIQVIDGKPGLSPRGALALLNSSGVLDEYDLKRIEDKSGNFLGYECVMARGKIKHTARFTLDDARRAHLTEGSPTGNGKRGYGNWEKYPENMCQWRAVGFCADVVAPDILAGMTGMMKMPEAYGLGLTAEGDIVEDSEYIEAEIQETTSQQSDQPAITLNELVSQYGAQAVMDANDGAIPRSDDELINIAAALVYQAA